MINIGNKKQNLPTKERKIFLNNMNSWFSNFVIEDLRTEFEKDPKITKNEFMGTVNNSNMKLPHLFKPNIIKIDYNFHYEHEVFKNDVFIYNLEDSDYNEIEYIIKGLKNLKHSTEKSLIIISSIMTWARTNPKIKKEKTDDDKTDPNLQDNESEDEDVVDEEPEEPDNNENLDMEGKEKELPKKYLFFKDKDYVLRVPSKKYYHYKMIETIALAAANTNPMLKTYIVCPGLIYGMGEDIFYEYFKKAWLMNSPNDKLTVISDGKNSIPTIHIKDLVSLIKRLIEKKPIEKYIFAVDRTKNRSLKNIITSISKSTGSGLIEHINPSSLNNSSINIPSFNELSINIKCKTSKVFDDTKEDDEDQEDFEKRCFKWHCEFGIPENLEKLRTEFTKYRNLKAQKILITGPPASGKTHLATIISKYYNLPHIKIQDIVEFGKNLPAGDDLGEEVKAKIEEVKDKMIEDHEEAMKKVKGRKKEPPLDRNNLNPKLPDELIVKILKRRLRDNICRNRGYILDGYPRGFNDSQSAFVEIDQDKPDEDPNKVIVLEDILPNSVIRLEGATDDYLKSRVKGNPELSGPHYTEESMNRRLAHYKLLNESIKGDLSLSDFYSKNKVQILPLEIKQNENDLMNKVKVFFEREGFIKNYMKFDEIDEEDHKKVLEEKSEIEEQKNTKEINE